MNKYDQNFYKNSIILKEFDIIKKLYGKIISRLYSKKVNYKYKTSSTKKLVDSNYTTSNKTLTVTESVTDISKASSNLKKEMTTSKVSTAFQNRNKRLGKILTFCMSEKILEKLNGQEFKDVLIKYFEKYFVMNDNDKFSFIQFADNGKKTAFFKPEPLNYFLLKFQKAKGTFELTDSFMTNTSSIFMELYNILDSIIKNYLSSEENDNIIMIFMDPEDIRFSSMDDCFSIVEDLNKKNASVYFFAYDENIKEEKVVAEFTKTLNKFDATHIKKLCGEFALGVIRDGVYYGYAYEGENGYLIQELPWKYCRSRYRIAGNPAIEFDMTFFDTKFPDIGYRMRVLDLFPPEFKEGYILYKKGINQALICSYSYYSYFYIMNYFYLFFYIYFLVLLQKKLWLNYLYIFY